MYMCVCILPCSSLYTAAHTLLSLNISAWHDPYMCQCCWYQSNYTNIFYFPPILFQWLSTNNKRKKKWTTGFSGNCAETIICLMNALQSLHPCSSSHIGFVHWKTWHRLKFGTRNTYKRGGTDKPWAFYWGNFSWNWDFTIWVQSILTVSINFISLWLLAFLQLNVWKNEFP